MYCGGGDGGGGGGGGGGYYFRYTERPAWESDKAFLPFPVSCL